MPENIDISQVIRDYFEGSTASVAEYDDFRRSRVYEDLKKLLQSRVSFIADLAAQEEEEVAWRRLQGAHAEALRLLDMFDIIAEVLETREVDHGRTE